MKERPPPETVTAVIWYLLRIGVWISLCTNEGRSTSMRSTHVHLTLTPLTPTPLPSRSRFLVRPQLLTHGVPPTGRDISPHLLTSPMARRPHPRWLSCLLTA
jgi:hypothetical protein